eukprot:1157259-Pelagomonas_calceolata.AAC.10
MSMLMDALGAFVILCGYRPSREAACAPTPWAETSASIPLPSRDCVDCSATLEMDAGYQGRSEALHLPGPRHPSHPHMRHLCDDEPRLCRPFRAA